MFLGVLSGWRGLIIFSAKILRWAFSRISRFTMGVVVTTC